MRLGSTKIRIKRRLGSSKENSKFSSRTQIKEKLKVHATLMEVMVTLSQIFRKRNKRKWAIYIVQNEMDLTKREFIGVIECNSGHVCTDVNGW